MHIHRYQRGPVLSFVIDYFGIRNLRDLSTITEQNPLFRQLRSVLKGLQVLLMHSGRIRTIKSIVLNAGNVKFITDDGQTTVQVSRCSPYFCV